MSLTVDSATMRAVITARARASPRAALPCLPNREQTQWFRISGQTPQKTSGRSLMGMLKATAIAAMSLCLGLTPALAQKSKDTLRLPANDPDAGIDTYLLPGSFANIYGPSVYDMLLAFDPDKIQIVGHLAASYKQIDPLTYEFELRTDVKWHDGQKFDADDVVYTINYLIDPKVTLRYKAYWAWIASVEKLSPTKVRINAKQPSVDGLMYLAARTPMYPEHVHGPMANKLDFGLRPVGTGPLRIIQMDQNTGVIGDKNRDYVPSIVKAASGVGRVISRPIKDMGTLTASMLTGEADVAIDLPPDQADALKQTGRFDVTLGPPSVGYTFLGFPSKGWENVKALGDERVRLAIIKAIDTDAVAKLRYGALAAELRPIEGLCVKEQLGCGFTKRAPTYDPAGAKKLLAEAGYADGFDVVISCFPTAKTDATAMAGMLRAVGIRATVREHPTAQRVQLINQGKVEIGLYGWSGGGMFEVSGQIGRHVESREYLDPELDKMAAATYTILDDAERRKAVAKVFDRITDQAYAFVTGPFRPVFTHTKEVVPTGRTLRAEQVNPHEFGWK
jgi:peptide/nickel transport system substrate-binding protein